MIVFEVLSPSNSMKTQLELIDDYQALSSVRQIVFVDQRRPYVFHASRIEAAWERLELFGLDAVLSLPAVAAELPLAEIYQDVFPDP